MTPTRHLAAAVLVCAGIASCGGSQAPTAAPRDSALPPPGPVYTVQASAFDPNDHDFDGVPDDHDLCPVSEEDGKGAHPWDGCADGRDPARRAILLQALPKQAVKLTRDQIKITEEIRFPVSSAAIEASSETLLQSIAQVLKDNTEIQFVEIAGHADGQGSDVANYKLTERRAASVMKDLVGKGITADRMRAVGYSSYCALDPGNNEAAHAKNRRVEFRILRRAGKDLDTKWGGCEAAEKRGLKPLALPKLRAEEAERRRKAESVLRGCTTDAEVKDCNDLCARGGVVEACLLTAGIRDGKPRVQGAGLFDAASKACKAGALDACPLTAKLLRDGTGTKKDVKGALELLLAACEKGGGSSCTGVALHHEKGLGTAKDEPQAATSYQDGCDLGDPEGCEQIASLLWAGRGVPKDPARAMDRYLIACELGRVSSCAAIAARFKEQPASLRARDRALAAMHVSCDQDPAGAPACQAIEALDEKPGEVRPARICAAGDYKACRDLCKAEPGNEACIEFGVAELYGIGVRRTDEDAAKRFAASCQSGRARACTLAALVREAGGDHPGAAEGYETACSSNEAPACVNRARLELEGLGTYRDEGAALRSLESACKGKSGVACAHLSTAAQRGLGAPADAARAAALLKQACAAGFKPACPAQ